MTYKIVRVYLDRPDRVRRRVIKRGLSWKQAQVWCARPDTSSKTCTPSVHRSRGCGATQWFDGFEEER